MKQAVILAAGEGQRLRPFTVTKPKVMLSVAAKPILHYVVESLAQNGIRNIVLVTGYRKEQIFDYLGSGKRFGVDIVYITQEKQLGTAHALAQAKDVVEDEFLVLPGDNLIEAGTISRFVSMKPNALLVTMVADTSRYGLVTVENGGVKDIIEKPRDAEGNIVSTGIYAFNREIFDFTENELSLTDVLNTMLAQDCVISALETDDTWLDVAYPWDILSLNETILRRFPASLAGTVEAGASVNGPVSIGKDTVVRPGVYIRGPVVIGDNCEIGPNVCILPSTSIGDNVVILPFTEVSNSVIAGDVNIGSGSIIQDSVIDEGCIIGGRFTACSSEAEVKANDDNHEDDYHRVNIGAMLGVGCKLGSSVVAQPGTILGNYSQVQALKLINGKLLDRSLVV